MADVCYGATETLLFESADCTGPAYIPSAPVLASRLIPGRATFLKLGGALKTAAPEQRGDVGELAQVPDRTASDIIHARSIGLR